MVSLLVITVVYLLFVAALVVGLGFDGLKASKQVAADVANRAFGSFGEKSIGVIVALAALTSINATMLVTARTNYSLGKDWRIFAFMSHWNAERDAPIVAMLTTSVITLLIVLIAAANEGGVKFMVDFTAPVFWLFFLLTGIGLFVLRFRYPHLARPFKVPLYPILPIVFVGTCVFLLYRSLLFYFRESGDPSCHLRDAVGGRRLAGRSAKEICVTQGAAPTNAAIVGIPLQRA